VTAAVTSQVWWWAARASGIVAWAVTAAAVAWGLALSSKVVRKRRIPAWLLDLHRYLGTLLLVFIAIHLGALAADDFTDFGVRELFVPMASAWKPGAVAWGIVAMYLVLVVQISSWFMRRLPRRLWHGVHLLSFAVFATATVHGVLAGTDRSRPSVQLGALALCLALLFFLVFRLLGAWGAIADEAVARGGPATRVAATRPPNAPQEEVDPQLADRLARLGSRARVKVSVDP
jgi:DMSO/TMAO reductase YedYZ heme-binding membrane subunit